MARRRRSPGWLSAAREQNRSPSQEDFDWLGRALARAGALPPSEIDQALAQGRVRVNGQVRKRPLCAVRPGDRVEVDGRPVLLDAPTLALMLHKPKGVVCAGADPEGVGTVFEVFQRALPEALRRYRFHAAGRLDRNTTGLLLFTNEERLVAHLTAPATHLPKRYLARVGGKPSEEKLKPLCTGLSLDDGPTRPALARLRGPDLVELTLTEGRHHQVKRMLGAVGLPVVELHREAIGALELDVAPGQVRALTAEEIAGKLHFQGK